MESTIYYVLGIIYFFLGISKFLYDKKIYKKTEIQYSNDQSLNINKLEQQEPSNKPPVILSIVLVACSFLLLAFGIWSIWSWSSGKISFNFDVSTIIFSIIFVIFPLAAIIDTFVIEPKRFKLGRSFVAKEVNVVLDLDVSTAFDKCLKALVNINANVIKFNKPKYIIALTNKSKFTITLRKMKGARSKANIICDSQWLTVKFDLGATRKNMNQFLKAL